MGVEEKEEDIERKYKISATPMTQGGWWRVQRWMHLTDPQKDRTETTGR
jgi:hypothetical protein